jgi:hypothetical protein
MERRQNVIAHDEELAEGVGLIYFYWMRRCEAVAASLMMICRIFIAALDDERQTHDGMQRRT